MLVMKKVNIQYARLEESINSQTPLQLVCFCIVNY